jgi:hypothetical protein
VRTLDLRPRFVRERATLAPRGTPEDEAIERILDDLEDERLRLPGIADHSVDLPPYVMGRTVPSSALVVAYLPAGDVVHVIALVKMR